MTLVTGDYSPYSGADLPEGGQSTRLVTRVLHTAGYHDLVVDYLPWARGYQQALNGLATATYPYARTRERELDFYYSDPSISITSHGSPTAAVRPCWLADGRG
ncbi:hypothetical protein [Aeromonas allosaccharophila]|uniref:hypothetical protein n=1 Tax=Aeromonas allosaccharophila TaxID=656 RepID=UPI003D1B966F